MSQSIAMPATAAYAGAPVTYAAPAPVTYAAPAAGPVTYAAPTYATPAAASQYVPAAATVQGYQQYMQTPQYAQYHLGQQQYIQADTNHDGVVSATELQAAQPIKHGLFGQHHGFGIYDHFVNHGAGAAQLAAAQPQTAVDPTAFTYAAATQQGYQQYMQTPQYAQYHLTQQQYIQADANHDGKVTAAEVQAEAQSIIQQPTQPAHVVAQPAPVVLPTASSMVAYPHKRPWVQESAERHLPSLHLLDLLEELSVDVIYAREEDKCGADLSTAEEAVLLKRLAMRRMLESWRFDGPEHRLTMRPNLLSIGDQDTEAKALQELADEEDAEGNRPVCKTLKLVERPTLSSLGLELESLVSVMKTFALSTRDTHLRLKRADELCLELIM